MKEQLRRAKRDLRDPGDAFRDAVRGVRPLAKPNRVVPVPPRPAPVPARRASVDSGGAMDDDGAYLRAGLPRDLQKKLRQIHWTIEEELDLHGLTAEGAEVETTRFLAECRRLGVRCVRIIHGKGLRSAGGEPVLKGRVRAHLARHPAVLAFVEPHAPDGGSGAVLVLLEA